MPKFKENKSPAMKRSGFKMTSPKLNKGFNIKKGKKNVGFGDLGTDKYGERDFSEHNIQARKTEGTIAEQAARRKKNK